MWKISKKFKTQKQAEKFILNHSNDYQCNLLFVHNGYKVEYKELKNIFEYHKKKVQKLPLNKWLKQFE